MHNEITQEAETEETRVDLSKHSYFFAMPCYGGMLHIETVGGMISTATNLTKHGINNKTCLLHGGTLIDMARNQITLAFLKSDCDTLVFLDSDIHFDWNAMMRLLAFNCKYPLVTGAYQQRTDPPTFPIKVDGPINEDGLMPISGIGLGFCAIKRSVFEALDQHNPITYDNKDGGGLTKAYFRCEQRDGKFIGEDIYFFQKCKEAGIQPMLDPYIELGHIGMKNYNVPFHKAIDIALKQLEPKEGEEK